MDDNYETINTCYRCIESAVSILNQIPDDVWNEFMSLPNAFVYDTKDGYAYLNRACDDIKNYLGIQNKID